MRERRQPDLSREEVYELMRLQNERKAAELKLITEDVGESSAPLSSDLLSRLLQLFPGDAEKALRFHSGFTLYERKKHYQSSLSVVLQCLEDLKTALVDFEKMATAEKAEIMKPRNRAALSAINKRIQKELFSTASAAHSLVDHTRRLNKRLCLPDFQAKLSQCFRDDGLHETIIGLRVLLHHLHIIEAQWSLSHNYRTGERTARFKIDKDELVRALLQHPKRFGGDKSKPIRKFLERCDDHIDVLTLAEEYRSRLDAFHGWLVETIKQNPPEDLQDYERCITEVENNSSRLSWSVFIGHWLKLENVPDIHRYLADYLTEEQREAVNGFPRNSKEQADKIIEFVDTKNAVDDSLRKGVHKLFERLDAQERAPIEL